MQISAAQSLSSFALRSSFGLASSSRGSQSSTLSLHDLLDQDEPDLYAATLSILSFGSALGSSASVADAGTASPSQESLLSSIQERLATVQSLYGDAAAATTDEERVQIQAAIDATIADISVLADVSLSRGSAQYAQVGELNDAQVLDLSVLELDANAEVTLQGTVTSAADHARLTVLGTEDGKVADAVSTTIGGSLGSVTLTWEQGESLESVAERINDLASATGVRASAQDSLLVLESVEVGSSAQVSLNATVFTGDITTRNVDAAQISNVSSNDFVAGSSLAVSGSVSQAAERAELRYVGDGAGRVNYSADVTVEGNRGSAVVTFTEGASLESVADDINREASSTGVSASVEDNQLVLRSLDLGADAFVSVDGGDSVGQVTASGVNVSQITSATVTLRGSRASRQPPD